MNVQQISSARNAEPFQPFTVRTADGRAYDVPHREFLWIPPEGRRMVFVYSPEDGAAAILDPRLVTAIEFGANGANGNGRA